MLTLLHTVGSSYIHHKQWSSVYLDYREYVERGEPKETTSHTEEELCIQPFGSIFFSHKFILP